MWKSKTINMFRCPSLLHLTSSSPHLQMHTNWNTATQILRQFGQTTAIFSMKKEMSSTFLGTDTEQSTVKNDYSNKMSRKSFMDQDLLISHIKVIFWVFLSLIAPSMYVPRSSDPLTIESSTINIPSTLPTQNNTSNSSIPLALEVLIRTKG